MVKKTAEIQKVTHKERGWIFKNIIFLKLFKLSTSAKIRSWLQSTSLPHPNLIKVMLRSASHTYVAVDNGLQNSALETNE